MKYVYAGLAALMLTACNGFQLPVIPRAPTVADAAEEQVILDENVAKVCTSIAVNEENLSGWLALADLLGGAFDIEVGSMVKIPSDLVKAKDKVCD